VRLTVPAHVASQGTTTQQHRRNWGKLPTIILFLIPGVMMTLLFVIYPMVQAIHYSLYKWNGLSQLTDYVGLKNFQTLFHDPTFIKAIENNILFAILSIVIQLPIALILALLLNGKVPGRRFFRTIFFMPFVLAPVVIGLVWDFIFNPIFGLIAGLLHQFAPHVTPPAVLADTHTVLPAIFLALCFEFIGFHFMLYTAGLQNIPPEVIEAARIDGASPLQVTRYVTLPLLGSTIRLTVLLSVIGSLQIFDVVYVLTLGGPVNSSQTMALYQYVFGVQNFAYGFGSAVAVVLFGLCFIFALLYQRLVMRQDLAGTSSFY
jgi:raffinose/stachyose/melibiose transport system permease protein